MKHERFFLSLEEWFEEEPKKDPAEAMSRVIQCLTDRGFRNFEREFSGLLDGFLGCSFDQTQVETKPKTSGRTTREAPGVYVTCFKRDDSLIFADIERFSPVPERPPEPKFLEIDLFARDSAALAAIKETVIDEAMRCFGLTRARETLVSSVLADSTFAKHLRDRLTFEPPIDDQLFQRLQDENDRLILRELRKRGSVLERDIHELSPPGVEIELVKRLLDYLSGEGYNLVDRKFAIVCKETDEIVFRYRSKDDFFKAESLECPQCSKPLGDETVMSYYGVTDGLKSLMDGNRWMPLLARDALIRAGIAKDDIYTEVKHGQDEIDVLAFFRDRVLVIEVKNRSVSLNDAYKLSAKTARIESIVNRVQSEGTLSIPDDDILALYTEHDYQYRRIAGRSRRGGFCIPVIVSTHEIAKDAQDLLRETNEAAKMLENSNSKMEQFLTSIVDEITNEEQRRRLFSITSVEGRDSVAAFALRQISRSFDVWRRSQSGEQVGTNV
jgi:hypothetical protein